jgi:hypothetical protein
MSEYTLEAQKKEACYMPTQRTFSGALLFLKRIMLCGKNIPVVFRVYKTKLEDCKEIPHKGARFSIIVQ